MQTVYYDVASYKKRVGVNAPKQRVFNHTQEASHGQEKSSQEEGRENSAQDRCEKEGNQKSSSQIGGIGTESQKRRPVGLAFRQQP